MLVCMQYLLTAFIKVNVIKIETTWERATTVQGRVFVNLQNGRFSRCLSMFQQEPEITEMAASYYRTCVPRPRQVFWEFQKGKHSLCFQRNKVPNLRGDGLAFLVICIDKKIIPDKSHDFQRRMPWFLPQQ